MADELELNDPRIFFVADYVLKTLKLKSDKFGKMYALDECKQMIHDFFDKADLQILIIQFTAAGALQPSIAFPNVVKNKSCYFIKKRREPMPKDTILRDALMYGDLSTSPVDQLSAVVDEVSSGHCHERVFSLSASFSFHCCKIHRTMKPGRKCSRRTSFDMPWESRIKFIFSMDK